jgi:hypothetical protein
MGQQPDTAPQGDFLDGGAAADTIQFENLVGCAFDKSGLGENGGRKEQGEE